MLFTVYTLFGSGHALSGFDDTTTAVLIFARTPVLSVDLHKNDSFFIWVSVPAISTEKNLKNITTALTYFLYVIRDYGIKQNTLSESTKKYQLYFLS